MSTMRPKSSKSTSNDLLTKAQAWLAEDPDPHTRQELAALLKSAESGDADGQAELQDRFSDVLHFGTAGLRGLLGAGTNRMNRSVVIRATAGLCAWVKRQVPDAEARGVCIGFDGRRMSREFAEDAASVALAAGLPVHFFPTVVATPVLAHSVLQKNAAAGVMVTASHNPPDYNGYKVYWGNGAQIIPPHDTGIAAEIAKIASLASVDRVSAPTTHAAFHEMGNAEVETYLNGVQDLLIHRDVPRDISIAYTALHGVGERFVRESLKRAGFKRVHSVAEQAEPDGRFPTVAFPNPEEDGAMDLVVALAKEKGADVVLANDPDADRLAVAVRDASGDYVMLNGNEIGCLLAHYLLDQGDSGPENKGASKRCVVSSIVSSPMLGAIAEKHGAHFEQSLTGFKWIANRAMELELEGHRFVFGYEEALGYCVGPLVKDKDGVSAVTLMAEMAAWCKSRGVTLLDERDEMWRRYGLFLSEQVSLVLPGSDGKAQIAATMDAARTSPPREIAGRKVTRTDDYDRNLRRLADGTEAKLGSPPSNVLVFEVQGGHRVMLRPSGTEPKLKYYHDVRVDMRDGESTEQALERGRQILADLVADFRRLTS